MVSESHPDPARRHLHAARADALLAKLDVYEDLAQLVDTETVPPVRARFAAQYERAIGVTPDERHALRSELRRLREDGARSIAETIARLRQSNRDAFGGAIATSDV